MKVSEESQITKSHLRELAFVFLKLGTTAFGGPAAHLAMMNDEMVIKRAWITKDRFLDLLSATNFIPGPSSTEMAIHIGYSRGGWKGLIVAGTCFIIPAALIVTAFAWLYVKYGSLPAAQTILYGIKPVIIAVVAQAIWSLTKSAVKNKWLAVLGVGSLAASFLGLNPLAVVAVCGFVSILTTQMKDKKLWAMAVSPKVVIPTGFSVAGTATLTAVAPMSLGKIFLFFLKIGSVLFGSGYVLLSFLKDDLVDKWHWLTDAQLLDAVAVGQFTPGPVFTTATFIGYILAGFKGAVLATVGIFLPAFAFVALTAPLIPKLRKSPLMASALDGVNVGSLAIMFVTCVFLVNQAVVDCWTLAIAALSGILLIRFKINSAWLVLGGGIAGVLLNL